MVANNKWNNIMKAMKNWYKEINKGQKIFLYLISTFLILLFGAGLLPLSVLIYLELGERGDTN